MDDKAKVHAALKSPMDLPTEFKSWLIKFIEANPPSLPAGQMLGYQPPNADLVSVKVAGAKGDGVTDDTRKIQGVIDKVAADGGGVVYFPAGTYLLTTYLTLGSNVTLLGQGRETVLKLSSSYVSGAQGQGHLFATSKSDITVDGISFDGNTGTLAPDGTNNFVGWFQACTRVTVRNCHVQNVNSAGSNINTAFVWAGLSHWGLAAGNRFFNCNGGAILFQGGMCAAIGNMLSSLGDVGIVWNSTSCTRGVAVGNLIQLIASQCAFGIENGASEWTITGNTISSCFGALDLNDAGYAGAQVSGGVFADNLVLDCDKGASSQTVSLGVFVRTSKTRDIKITDNIFSGLTPYSTTDAFIYVTGNTEGLEIRGNIFEGKAQALPACVFFQTSTTHSRLVIADNSMRSTSTVTKLSKGIWLASSSTYTNSLIARNSFDNITNYAVHFDTSVSWSGELSDNLPLSTANVGAVYQTSPWGTFAPAAVALPHVLRNTQGRSIWYAGAIPTGGTWLQGDIIWNTGAAAGSPAGWICVTGGTPGTWKSIGSVGGSSTQTPGAVTTVNIPHGLGYTPNYATVVPATATARGAPAFHVSKDATNIVLNFAAALTAATSYSWTWSAG